MTADPRKRQKKLERRAAKRSEKKHKLVRAQPAGLADRMAAAAKYPPLHAWIPDVLETEGIASVLFSRELPNGMVAVAVFLVDRYCLGVKDALANVLTRSAYEGQFVREMRSQFPARDVSPACVRKLVEAAVAYAGNLGFAPHPDYHKAKMLFGAVDAGDCAEEFEFGKDGKPFFVAGPHDSLARCRQIVSILNHKCGPGGFEYFVPLAGPEEILPGGLLEGPEDVGGEGEGGNLLDFQDEEPDEA
jgi:hypothetical protein